MAADNGLAGVLLSTFSTSSGLSVVIATLVLLAFYLYQRYSADDWSRYGIKCHKIPGNALIQINLRHVVADCIQKYGETFGLQSGSLLILVTTNRDLWRNILIKDFSNFTDRQPKVISSTPFFKSLIFAPGSEWRKHRQIVSPTFTTGKLKHISNSVQKSAQDLTDYLEKHARSGSPVLIKDTCGKYTSEIIAKTAFGLDAKFIGQKDVEFYNYSNTMIEFNKKRGFIFNLLQSIPYLRTLSIEVFKLQYYDPANLKASKYFDVILKNTIQQRKLQQKKGIERPRSDLLDLLIKANEEAEAGNLEKSEELESIQDDKDAPKRVQKLGYEEMLGHSMLVIFAGMETTATTLQMCLYELAVNPDIQDKVVQEIRHVVKHDAPTSEELNRLTYTQQVFDEVLRLYPPAPIVKRMAAQTKTYNGVTIPKGAMVVLPYFHAHMDPTSFPDPHKFDPDRFSPEEKEKRDSLAFSPFGHGPRICLGMRLAYLELKQGLVHILRRLKVVLNDKTEPKKGAGRVRLLDHNLVVPEKPIALDFELRE